MRFKRIWSWYDNFGVYNSARN